MAKAIPLIGALAGAALAGPLGLGLLNAGIGLSAAQGILAGKIAGFLVSTAISQVGSRALAKKPKAQAFAQESSGRSLILRSSVESHKIIYGRARVSGPLAYSNTTSSGLNSAGEPVSGDNKFLHLVIPLAGHEVAEIETVYLNDTAVGLNGAGFVITGPYLPLGRSKVRVKKHLGAADQAADADLVAECGLTADHRLRGIAYVYVRLEYDAEVFPLGIPNVSAVVKGKKVYDPRTALTAWSENAALCVRDYLTADYGFGCAADEIADDHFIAAANVCDESVTTTTGTQARYTCNGVVDTAAAPLDNLGSLVTPLAGAVTYVQGQFRLHAGAYDAPAGTITADMLAGPVRTSFRTERKELFNAVKGTYVDPDRGWQPTDFPFVTNPAYEADDGGERIYTDLELPFTTDPEAAQRIGKLVLEKARQGIKVEMPLNHSAMRYTVYDVVTVTLPAFGWAAKPFRVVKATPDGTGPVVLSLQEESSASYDWDDGEATPVDPAPDTNLPDPLVVAKAGPFTIREELYVTRSGDGVKTKAILSWLPSPDVFVTAYEVRYRYIPSGIGLPTDWFVQPRVSDTYLEIEDLTPGTYQFNVFAINNFGVYSEYSGQAWVFYGLLAPPTEPQNLTISTIGGLAIMRWDQSPDLDVRIGGKIVFRHSPTPSDGWSQSTSIGDALPGSSTVAILPLKAGVYLAKAVDSSGIESEAAASVTTGQATALAYANVSTLTEHPGFTGAKTNVYVTSGTLRLAGAGLFDAIPSLDPISSLDEYGGLATSGTYETSGAIDLGSVMRVRLTSTVQASVFNALDMIDERTNDIDGWDSFDGTGSAAADAVCYVRTTNDDPSGSPTWGAYHRLDSGEFQARAFDPQLRLSTTDPAYNIAVSQFVITVEEVA